MFPAIGLDSSGDGESIGCPFFRCFHFPVGSPDFEFEPVGVVLMDEISEFDFRVGKARSGAIKPGTRFLVSNGFVAGVSIKDLEE